MVGAVVLLAVVIRVVTGVAPVVAALLVGLVALVAAAYGVWANGHHHGREWQVAWSALSLGLLCVVSAAVVDALVGSARSSTAPLSLILLSGGGVLAVAGLASLIAQRLPGRAAEALAEAMMGALALGLLVVAFTIVPSRGWHPARDLPAMAVPMIFLVALWLAVSLTSLTARHPVGYRYLIAGLACLFAVSGTSWVLTMTGRSSWVSLGTLSMWGACLWAGALLHPSHRAAFDPVPARSTRPSGAHVAMLLVCTLVVPGVLALRFMNGDVHQPGILLGALVLPLTIVLYLLHKVFAHAAAEYRAQHDPLTGVCNRTLFEDRVKTALTQAQRSGTGVGVMFLDLDRFKSINDSLGHAVGNQVLQAVVKRLQSCLRAHDTVARMGGDEFTLLLPDLEDKAQCAGFAERALAVFDDPIAIGGRMLTVQASVGIALFPQDGEDVDSLLKNADMAMYQAKAAGRNTFEVYDSAMSVRAKLRFALEASLRAAVESGRLAVHYQPKYDTATGEIAGAEALARWQHPRLGFIPPWAFIPLAEESTLVDTLGEWVLETVCRQAEQWHRDGLLRFPVAVNMSARQIARPSLVTLVSGVLERTGLDASLLEIEVTESVLVEQMGDVTATLTALRAIGVRCSIDDFGTGYSALTYLAEFPVDEIKIDRSFVSRIDSDVSAGAIVGAVIALAHSLGLEVVAEGVETEAQFQYLKASGCDQVQGFLFSPAVPADEFALLARGPADLRAGVTSGSVGTPEVVTTFPQERLAAVLDTMEQTRGRSGELDLEGIESILAILQRDDLVALRDARTFGSLPARLAIGTLAGLTTVTGGLTAAGAITPSARQLAVHVLETGAGVSVSPPPETSSVPDTSAGATPRPASGGAGGHAHADPSLAVAGVADFADYAGDANPAADGVGAGSVAFGGAWALDVSMSLTGLGSEAPMGATGGGERSGAPDVLVDLSGPTGQAGAAPGSRGAVADDIRWPRRPGTGTSTSTRTTSTSTGTGPGSGPAPASSSGPAAGSSSAAGEAPAGRAPEVHAGGAGPVEGHTWSEAGESSGSSSGRRAGVGIGGPGNGRLGNVGRPGTGSRPGNGGRQGNGGRRP